MSNTDKRAIIFAQYPNQKGFWFAKDDQAFFQEGDAKNHDKDAEFVKNPNYKGASEESDEQGGSSGKSIDTDEADKKTLRAKYKELYGTAAFNGWDEAKLQEMIAAKQG